MKRDSNDVICATVTENDAPPFDDPIVYVNGSPAVNDFGETFSIGQQCIEQDQNQANKSSVTGYNFKANSDAYLPRSEILPKGFSLGINQDSASLEVFKGNIELGDSDKSFNTYQGWKFAPIGHGLEDNANNTQNFFHRFLNNVGFKTDNDPVVFNNDGPDGFYIGHTRSACTKDLVPHNPVSINACAELSAGLSHINTSQGLSPHLQASKTIRAEYNFGGEDSNNMVQTPLGISNLSFKSEENPAPRVFGELKSECSVGDTTSVIKANGHTADHCDSTGKLGLKFPVGELGTLEISAGETPLFTNNTNFNKQGTFVEGRFERRF